MTVKQIFKQMKKFDETKIGYYLKDPFMKIELSINFNFQCEYCR